MSRARRGRRLIALLLVVNLALAGVLLYAARDYLPWRKPQQDAPMNQEQLAQVSSGMTGVTYHPEPYMKDGKIAVMLSNGSAEGCSVRLELILLTDNQLLAKTDLIDAGYRLEYMTANRKLTKGAYPCLLRVDLYTPEGKRVGSAGRSLLLNVE